MLNAVQTGHFLRKDMEKAANFILKHRKAVLITFLVLTAICVLLFPLVGINYDMSEYLPDSAPSTQAIKVMKEEFGTAIPSAEVMLPPMSLAEARQKKSELEQLSFVTEVNWLDDLVDLAQPLAMTDPELIDTYYKDQQPLFLVTVDDGYSNVTMQQYLHDFAGKRVLSGARSFRWPGRKFQCRQRSPVSWLSPYRLP